MFQRGRTKTCLGALIGVRSGKYPVAGIAKPRRLGSPAPSNGGLASTRSGETCARDSYMECIWMG